MPVFAFSACRKKILCAFVFSLPPHNSLDYAGSTVYGCRVYISKKFWTEVNKMLRGYTPTLHCTLSTAPTTPGGTPPAYAAPPTTAMRDDHCTGFGLHQQQQQLGPVPVTDVYTKLRFANRLQHQQHLQQQQQLLREQQLQQKHQQVMPSKLMNQLQGLLETTVPTLPMN